MIINIYSYILTTETKIGVSFIKPTLNRLSAIKIHILNSFAEIFINPEYQNWNSIFYLYVFIRRRLKRSRSIQIYWHLKLKYSTGPDHQNWNTCKSSTDEDWTIKMINTELFPDPDKQNGNCNVRQAHQMIGRKYLMSRSRNVY